METKTKIGIAALTIAVAIILGMALKQTVPLEEDVPVVINCTEEYRVNAMDECISEEELSFSECANIVNEELESCVN